MESTLSGRLLSTCVALLVTTSCTSSCSTDGGPTADPSDAAARCLESLDGLAYDDVAGVPPGEGAERSAEAAEPPRRTLLGSWGDGALRIWREGQVEIVEYRSEPGPSQRACPCLAAVELGVVNLGFAEGLDPSDSRALLAELLPELSFELQTDPSTLARDARYASFRVAFVPGSELLPAGSDPDEPLQRLRASVHALAGAATLDQIDWTEPNPIFSVSQTRDTNHDALAAMHVPEAWTLWGGKPARTGVIDTGLTRTPGLEGHVAGMDCVRAGAPSTPCLPDPGHGTQMAAILGCPLAEGIDRGVAGPDVPDPEPWLWAIQVNAGSSLLVPGDELIDATTIALDREVALVTLAFNGPCASRLVYEALRGLDEKGVWMFASAGNDGIDLVQRPSYPASFVSPPSVQDGWPAWSRLRDANGDPTTFEPLSHLVPIGSLYSLPAPEANAVRMNQVGTPFFHLYPSETSNYSSEPGIVDFWAPGASVWGLHSRLHAGEPLKVELSGTSFATAHAAGVAAMALSEGDDPELLRQWLRTGGRAFNLPKGADALYPEENRIVDACGTLAAALGAAPAQCGTEDSGSGTAVRAAGPD